MFTNEKWEQFTLWDSVFCRIKRWLPSSNEVEVSVGREEFSNRLIFKIFSFVGFRFGLIQKKTFSLSFLILQLSLLTGFFFLFF